MSITLVGLSFHTAPVALRERLALGRDALSAALARQVGAGEIVALSTCNRFEVYLADAAPDRALAFMASECGVASAAIAPMLYVHRDAAAVKHLLTVAAGLDSRPIWNSRMTTPSSARKAITSFVLAGSTRVIPSR